MEHAKACHLSAEQTNKKKERKQQKIFIALN